METEHVPRVTQRVASWDQPATITRLADATSAVIQRPHEQTARARLASIKAGPSKTDSPNGSASIEDYVALLLSPRIQESRPTDVPFAWIPATRIECLGPGIRDAGLKFRIAAGIADFPPLGPREQVLDLNSAQEESNQRCFHCRSWPSRAWDGASSRRKCDTILVGDGGEGLIGGPWNSKLLARCSSSPAPISQSTTMAQVRRLRYHSLETSRNTATLMNIDRRAILTNPDVLSSTPWSRLLENDFWGTPLNDRGSHGSYRPLCVATFRLNHLLGGLDPWGYHLVNVALHAACTVLVVRVARKVLPGRNNLGHAIAGFLFAAHPIHSEAVAGVVGRADLLACLLTLSAFLAYSVHCERTRSSFPLILALASSTLATLAKETGISSLALCLLWELCRGESGRKVNCGLTRTRSIGIVSGSLALLVLGRLRITGTRPEFASADNPTARHPSRLTRGLTFLYLPAASAKMLLCPSTLSFDWSMDAVPRITSLLDARNLESACLYTALIGASIWTIRTLRRPPRDVSSLNFAQYHRSVSSRCPVCAGRRTGGCHTDGCRAANNNNNGPIGDCHCAKRPNSGSTWSNGFAGRQATASSVATSLGFLVLPFLPASNLFFYVGFVIAERILYLPSVGACLIVGAAISSFYHIARRHGSRRRGRIVLLATAILVCLMSAKTLSRNTDWFDEESLYKSALHVNPPKGYSAWKKEQTSRGAINTRAAWSRNFLSRASNSVFRRISYATLNTSASNNCHFTEPLTV
ncbi:hypothetical protein WN48_07541 [Eufriesea mexicana]|uniref:DUF1736 domain-containing protein n=1 Tax=Eufriesea mexicana TaxID=516756 RepID=A0A310SN78_9HYME|nr:hypothetical protein WN48_07541 [Eufriesea mexicana]